MRAAEGPETEGKEQPPEKDAGAEEERAFLSSLWEQWGLLGLLVGAAVAFGGLDALNGDLSFGESLFAYVNNGLSNLPFFMKDTVEGTADAGVDVGAAASGGVDLGVGEMIGALGSGFAAGVSTLAESSEETLTTDGPDALKTAAESAAATIAGAQALAGGTVKEAAEAVSEMPTIGAELEMEAGQVMEQELAAGAGLGVSIEAASTIAGQVGFAGAVGATSSFAGLVVEGVQTPKQKEGTATFLDISETTPGTVRQSTRSVEEQAEDVQDRPASAWSLGMSNFMREWEQLLKAARKGSQVSRRKMPAFVPQLQLSNQAVIDREMARPDVPTPVPVRIAYEVLCKFIDIVFEDRPIPRFWFLETVARMPYFSYSSVLHLYETLGWWRSPELRGVHAAEEDNELHHLLIMESLGGDQRWLDRFFAQHSAVAYYWLLVLFYLIDPRWSYNFSRLIEAHAVDTYGEFRDANEERLKSLPPPPVAIEYYRSGDLYLFDRFQTTLTSEGKVRRPPCSTLYDVFANICDDEEQHVLTMEACEEWVAGGDPAVPLGFNRLSVEDYEKEVTRTDDGRAAWVAWGEEVAMAAREAGRQAK